MVQRRRELTPMDLLKGAASQLGPFGASLAVGLQKTSTQVGPAVRQLSAMAKRELEAARPVEPTKPVPTGPFLQGIDRQVMRQRPIGTPQIIDKHDLFTARQENNLQKYVKAAMGRMPIGTDTGIEPTVTVVPRTEFHQRVAAMGGDEISPAITTGRNSIIVSDELLDLTEKERRAVLHHETYHALRHWDRSGRRLTTPDVEEREAMNFENQYEPEGANAARSRFSAIAQQQRGGGGMMGTLPVFGR